MVKVKLLVGLVLVGIILLTVSYVYHKKSEIKVINDEAGNIKGKQEETILQESSLKQVIPWGINLINSELISTDNSKIKIAILDSGINKDHKDLVGLVKKQYNAISPDIPVVDDFGHGTAVAGIIGANNNGYGVLGVNSSGVEIYDVKVLDAKGKGTIDQLIKGIEWSITENVDIINISSGVVKENKSLENIIKKAVSSGILIVAAAGNTYGTGVNYPAKYNDVLSINSIKESYKRPSSAARGKIDYVAPGVDILSTDKDGGYSFFTGTSFASAHATGVISVILGELKKESKYKQSKLTFVNELTKYITVNKEFSKKEEYGNGLLTIK